MVIYDLGEWTKRERESGSYVHLSFPPRFIRRLKGSGLAQELSLSLSGFLKDFRRKNLNCFLSFSIHNGGSSAFLGQLLLLIPGSDYIQSDFIILDFLVSK